MSGFRIMRCSTELVTQFVQGECQPADTDLPEDAEVVGVLPQTIPDTPPWCVFFILKSDEWEPVPEGCCYEEITPTYRDKREPPL